MSEIAAEQDKPRPSATAHLKVPPHSVEAEQSVLGGLMLNNDAWFGVADVLASRDFYRPQHQIIYEAMTALANANQPLDAVTVSESLTSRGVLDKAGGIAYLAELAENTPGASNVLAYAHIVRERSTLRQLITAAQRIVDSAFTPQGRSSHELLDMAESEVFRIHEGRLKEGGTQPVVPLLTRAVERIGRPAAPCEGFRLAAHAAGGEGCRVAGGVPRTLSRIRQGRLPVPLQGAMRGPL